MIVRNIEVIPFIVFTLIHVSFSWFTGGWYDKYRYLSYQDPLTGVYNRRNERIGIINIDIDNFKLINDTDGHSYGDFILKEICSIIVGTIHKKDILVKWCGDEFLLLLIDIDYPSAQNPTNQIN